MEGVEVNISCQTEDLGNVTPTLRLTGLGLAAQTLAGVETLLHIAIVLDVLTTDLVGYHSTHLEVSVDHSRATIIYCRYTGSL